MVRKVLAYGVIGANYGDEGKGLATNYFALQHPYGSRINIMTNGGAQRGHTVELEGKDRFITQHFGASSYMGVPTYCSEYYMVNPIVWYKFFRSAPEYQSAALYIDENCRVTTPYEMRINQFMEDYRRESKSEHGSCGYGIWETDQRYKAGYLDYRWKDFLKMSDDEVYAFLRQLREDYMPKRLAEYGIDYDAIDTYRKVFLEDDAMDKMFVTCLNKMKENSYITNWDEVQSNFDIWIFENAQGLLLSEDNKAELPNVTASNTGSKYIFEMLSKVDTTEIDLVSEICYVTRTYLTRHGAGNFESLSLEEINSQGYDINFDMTNVYNTYQGYIRYGELNVSDLFNRIKADFYKNLPEGMDTKLSVMTTHLNEIENESVKSNLLRISDYISASVYPSQITKF